MVAFAYGGESGQGGCDATDDRGGEVEGFGGGSGFVKGVVEGDRGAFAIYAMQQTGDGEV